MEIDWIDANQKLPKRQGDSSALVLIARPLRSRPKRLVVTVGYLQKFDAAGEWVWVDALSRVPDLPSVRYWMPMPDPPAVRRAQDREWLRPPSSSAEYEVESETEDS